MKASPGVGYVRPGCLSSGELLLWKMHPVHVRAYCNMMGPSESGEARPPEAASARGLVDTVRRRRALDIHVIEFVTIRPVCIQELQKL